LKDKLLMTNFDKLGDHGSIKSQKVKLASVLWVSFIQHKRFSDVYVAIHNRKRHYLQTQLAVKANEFEVLRCYVRYLYADLPKSVKYHKSLPRHKHFSDLVIEEVQRRLVHTGVSHTLSQVRPS